MPTDYEVSEDSQQEPIEIGRYVNFVRRRHMLFLVPMVTVWLLVWLAAWVIPAKYASSTTILLEGSSMPKDYVTSNVGEDLQARLQTITQQIMNRTRLLAIIDSQHLYGGGGPEKADDRVEQMRKDIQLDLVQNPGQKGISGFTLTYTAHDPRLAQHVASELTDLFIDENQKDSQQQSQETTNFLQTQLDSSSAQLAEQEAKIRVYQSQHEGELPTQQTANIQILAGLQSQLQGEQDGLNNARQQGIYFKALVDQYKAQSGVTDDGIHSDSLPVINQHLDQLRNQLALLSGQYTDQHPDVQSLKREIVRTEKMRDDLVASLKEREKTPKKSETPSSAPAPGQPMSPAYLQAQSQLEANRAEIANREQAVNALKARVVQYQARLSAEPMREQELANLTRGYDQLKATYDDLLKKKGQSEMATSMVQMMQGERFRIVDPPGLPSTPAFPNRIKFCAIGVAAGALFGLLIALLFEFLDDRVYSEQELRNLLPVPVLAEIPEIVVPGDLKARKRKARLGWAAASAVALMILAGFAFTALHG